MIRRARTTTARTPRAHWLLVALVASGCGASVTAQSAHLSQATVAERFSTALARGDVPGARDLLVHPDEGALVYLVRRAASWWKRDHVSIRLPARRSGDNWKVSFAGRRTFRDGRFESAAGDLIVRLGPAPAGPRVAYFFFADVRTRSSTHHDSQLLPSKR